MLAEQGRHALTTRAVAAARRARPHIYRQFSDVRGLLDAVATTVSTPTSPATSPDPHDDPVDDLRSC